MGRSNASEKAIIIAIEENMLDRGAEEFQFATFQGLGPGQFGYGGERKTHQTWKKGSQCEGGKASKNSRKVQGENGSSEVFNQNKSIFGFGTGNTTWEINKPCSWLVLRASFLLGFPAVRKRA